jgi:hypothetical protein
LKHLKSEIRKSSTKLTFTVADAQLKLLIEDVHLFCCSFVKEDISEDMSIDEISAFDEEALEKVIKKD